MLNPCANLQIDSVESATQRTGRRRQSWENGAESGPQQMVVGSGEEQGNAKAEACQTITMRVGNALDQAMQSQTAQMTGHFAWCELLRIEAGQRSQAEAKLTVGKTGGKQIEKHKSMPQSLYISVAEAKG